MPITHVKKRNGSIAEFDRARIERAIEKACLATETYLSPERIIGITDDVVNILEQRFAEGSPSVEQIQDYVERELMRSGLYPVARAYILYREDQKHKREQEHQKDLQKVEKHQLKVTMQDGGEEIFDTDRLRRFVENCAEGFNGDIDVDGVVQEATKNIYDGIPVHEIVMAVVMAGRGRIEQDPSYSFFSARALFNGLYHQVLGINEFKDDFEKRYRATFMKKIEEGVSDSRYDKRMLDFDFKKLTKALRPSRDRLLMYLGAQTLYDRYFLKNHEQEIIETPQYFWMRVAMGLSLNEENKEERAIEFYEILSQLRYVSSTPTLFHSGTTHPQMSSCYLTTVEDDLSHIFKSIADNAQLSKWSGGLGNDWTNIRGTGSMIHSTNVGSQGVIPFLKIVDSTTAAINRSGKRRGATCVYLETWHYDIESFLELRKNTGDERRRTHDTNTSNWIPDLFMKRVMNGEQWTLFSSDETPDLHGLYGKEFEKRYEEYESMADKGMVKYFKRLPAEQLWRKMITMLFETGHPWITFKDACNIRSPQDHVGVVNSSNLCTEITLNTSKEETAVCNLGSINLNRHISPDGVFDWDLMRETALTAMRMLDNVIDLNFYPTKEAETSNRRHRPVGLGIMGFQDVLYKMNMCFDSDEAVDLSDRIQEFVSYYAIFGSSQLAKERGTYKTYKQSKWDRGLFPLDTLKLLEEERGLETGVKKTTRLDWGKLRDHVKLHGMRNSNTMAIAPTATIANIAGTLPSIEPIYKNLYVKSNFSGEFTIINKALVRDLKNLNLWGADMLEKIKHYDGSIRQISEIPDNLKEKYKEVFEIDAQWIIKHAAYRGKWIDQSQSVNIFTTLTSGRAISEIYMNAWKMGMKTTYYLRTLGASSIEKSTIDINRQYSNVEAKVSEVAQSAPIVPNSAETALPKKKPNVHVFDDELCEACQ